MLPQGSLAAKGIIHPNSIHVWIYQPVLLVSLAKLMAPSLKGPFHEFLQSLSNNRWTASPIPETSLSLGKRGLMAAKQPPHLTDDLLWGEKHGYFDYYEFYNWQKK